MLKSHPPYSSLLQTLKTDPGSYHSGTLLASTLGLSRSTIWRHIQSLKSLGYDIQSHPRHGYRLVAVPDLLISEEVLPALSTNWLPAQYHHFHQIGSTNDHAMSLASTGAPHGTVIVAEEQTQGRGRLRRPWISHARSGIYMSILLRTPLPVRHAPQSTYVAALALVKVLRHRYHLSAAIKWPNDVLVDGKKVAGILTEMQSDQEFTRFLIIGIGINVNHTREELEGPFRYPATSLAAELGVAIQRQDLLRAFLEQFETHYDRFTVSGFSALMGDFEEASATLGRNIHVHCGDSEYSGRAVGLTREGALRLLTQDGGEKIIWVGDVTQVQGATEQA